jgi:hypothetical protein
VFKADGEKPSQSGRRVRGPQEDATTRERAALLGATGDGMDLESLEAAARRELARNGLHGWTFGLSKTKRRLGVCKYRQKRIEIAEYYLGMENPHTMDC